MMDYANDEGFIQAFYQGNPKVSLRGNGISYLTGGNVGIGTTNPSSPSGYAPILAVAGTAPVFVLNETDTGKVSEIGLNGGVLAFTTAGGIAPLKIDSASAVDSTLYLKAGNVGVGTTSPDKPLQVIGANSGQGIEVANTSGGGRREVSMAIDSTAAYLDAYNYATGAAYPLDLQPNGGNLGVGTNTPNNRLNVIGTGNFTSTLFAGSCAGSGCTDIAELYPSNPDVTPGDVVCRGLDGNATPCAAGLPLLGVVSTHPAIIIDGDHVVLGEADNASSTSRPIALKGRVPVKVQCPVLAGDYLIPSSTPGYAATLYLGAATVADSLRVLGTSIEDCASGNTTLMVWLR